MKVSPLRFACPKVGKEGKAGEAQIPSNSVGTGMEKIMREMVTPWTKISSFLGVFFSGHGMIWVLMRVSVTAVFLLLLFCVHT